MVFQNGAGTETTYYLGLMEKVITGEEVPCAGGCVDNQLQAPAPDEESLMTAVMMGGLSPLFIEEIEVEMGGLSPLFAETVEVEMGGLSPLFGETVEVEMGGLSPLFI